MQIKRTQKSKKAVALTMMKKKATYVKGENNLMNKAVGIILAQQMSAKRGIKLFGEKAISAIIKEFTQLDQGAFPGKPVVHPLNAHELSIEEKRKALEAVNLIAKKRCGKIKGRTCADGSKQRKYLKDGESIASPTVSLESLISSLLIDTYEDRYVSIFDVPGAYLHAETPKGKLLIIKLRGEFADIMCQTNDKYKKYIHYENGNKVLYLQVLRALYGCIESAMLWYALFTSTLIKMGFEINPYDRCIANKVIDGNQCTIAWYVDDVKISHQNKRVVKSVIEDIEKHFGNMNATDSKTFDYLGMNITIRDDRKIEIEMKAQIEEAIESFGEKISENESVSSPTPKHLFQVDDSCERLDKKHSELYHSITAKLLYLEKRARPDIETAVAFLTTRVVEPTTDDWKN